MGLNIKNERAIKLVRELAARTNQGMTSAVEDAVGRYLNELDSPAPAGNETESKRDKVDFILTQIWAEVEVDPGFRDRVDAELYDLAGLPR